MASQELSKVTKKENGGDDQLGYLKIMLWVPLHSITKGKTIHWALCTQGSFTTQTISFKKLHRLHLHSISKDNKKWQPSKTTEDRKA